MNAHFAAAVGNAQVRARIGWPLALLAVALYAPNVGGARLLLIAAGLVFLARRPAQPLPAPVRTGRPAPAQPTARTPKPQRPATPPAEPTAKKPPVRRGPGGRWTSTTPKKTKEVTK